jgi:hypothetical protein
MQDALQTFAFFKLSLIGSFLSFYRKKNVVNAQLENPGNRECEREARIIAAAFNCDNCLAGNAQPFSQIGLCPTLSIAQVPNVVSRPH